MNGLSETEELDVIHEKSSGFVTGKLSNGDGGDLKEDEEEDGNPEDCIPDLPENQAAREFLKNAPRKGLFMPLGKEVKVMQCWRCKAFGHRTGDRECPMRLSGNTNIERQRQQIEDPMSAFATSTVDRRLEKYQRVEQLKALVELIRDEEKERKRRKEEKKKAKKLKKESKRSKKVR